MAYKVNTKMKDGKLFSVQLKSSSELAPESVCHERVHKDKLSEELRNAILDHEMCG
ncbi:hypothetical protein PV04_02757 [Phialophora macrospora]|uniref:Uncharacterized protein n=1 Tax=Phialophora macrospora TaxID=1851006 RepID=A0A0D2FQD2_9EURO|nr:hypothetical protein PV04_02757 [Phialophora macrospora]